jgi:hypothetical protein
MNKSKQERLGLLNKGEKHGIFKNHQKKSG